MIELSGVPGRTAIWADPLNEGPVPGDIADEELLQVRARFLAASNEDVDDVAADLRLWRALVDDDSRYRELVLWFEHDLFDQLNLIQLLAHIGGRPRSTPVALICIDRFPGHPNFKGLGELEPRDIAALFETRRPVAAEQIALAERAWLAYRSPDPRAIESLLEEDTQALPFLRNALARHLEEFPSEADGLSRTERRLMQLAAGDGMTSDDAFRRMHDGETAHYVADSWFSDRVNELSAATPPLVKREATTIKLTEQGRDVLSGHADRVKLCGIDRWLGGVHVHGRGRTWRWSERAGRLIEA